MWETAGHTSEGKTSACLQGRREKIVWVRMPLCEHYYKEERWVVSSRYMWYKKNVNVFSLLTSWGDAPSWSFFSSAHLFFIIKTQWYLAFSSTCSQFALSDLCKLNWVKFTLLAIQRPWTAKLTYAEWKTWNKKEIFTSCEAAGQVEV